MDKSDPRKAQRQLPPGYARFWSFDISQTKEALNLSFGGAAILLVAWIGFLALARLLQPAAFPDGFLFKSGSVGETLVFLAELAAVTIVMVVLHEGLHGLCFWLFTGERPRFALKVYYAYAAAPDWFFPRGQYFITALAPLAGITLLGVAALVWLPPAFAFSAFLLLVFNTSGAVGDIWVALRLLSAPRTTLINDCGDKIEFFCQA